MPENLKSITGFQDYNIINFLFTVIFTGLPDRRPVCLEQTAIQMFVVEEIDSSYWC